MKKSSLPYIEILTLAALELAVAALTVLGYFLVSLLLPETVVFDYRVFTGAALGALVIILNYLFLTISVNRSIDSFIRERGSREMDDEEAERFAAEHGVEIQNKIKTSFLIRTVTILITLVLAFVLDWFDPIATAIPLLIFRPLLTLTSILVEKIRQRTAFAADRKESELNGA